MEERKVDILFLDTIEHEKPYPGSSNEKASCQDQIKLNDPAKLELLRIPHNGRNMYNKFFSKTQKQPIKSFEVYFRNLNKKNARFDIITCSSSQLLVSSTSDILIPIRQPIYTDLIVIRGSFTSITLCVYGRVIYQPEEIQQKCPYFKQDIEVPIKSEPQQFKTNRDVFEESRTMVRAIQDEYSRENEGKVPFSFQEKFNDSYLHQQQIKNITSFSAQLQKFEDLTSVNETQIAFIRKILQDIQTNLSKLLKSSHIGLFYPPGHRSSSIPEEIPTSMMKTLVQLLSLDLSDQCRALEVLKMILQLHPHADFFVQLAGVESLIHILIDFFSPNSVIFSSLKSLLIEVLIGLSFWKSAAQKMVAPLIPQILANAKEFNSLKDGSEQKEKQKSRERSRDKKKKKSSQQRSQSRRKQKKSKKHKDKKKGRSPSNVKDNKKNEQEKQTQNTMDELIKKRKYFQNLRQCSSLYEVLFKIIRIQSNSKLLYLMRILLQQITQTLTKDEDLSMQMANYTPLLRDTKYMFNQGSEIIGNKSVKMFSSFKPFLNEEQSRGSTCDYICQKEKIKNPVKYDISLKLFKMIDAATSVFQAKNQFVIQNDDSFVRLSNSQSQYYDEQFLTLLSALILENDRGVDLGINYFIDAIKIQELAVIKKNEGTLALIFQYLYEVFLQCNEYTLVYYMDQIFHIMIKYVAHLGVNKENYTNKSSSEDKNCTKQLKQKMNFLINLALPYNAFNGTQNSFKGLTQNFVKLFSYEHFQISKISEYRKKQYEKSINPLSFATLTDAFNLGNFHEFGARQPLLEIDVCLKFFLVLLKFNKNIWATFYEHKLVSAFSCLFLKIHAMLKFFLTPSLERQNAICQMREHERVIENYLRVAQDLTGIFIEKIKYQSAFNELTEEEEIFDRVELYEKWFDTYLFLTNSLTSNDFMINKPKIKQKIEIVLAHIIEIFDTVLLSFEITKHSSRQSKIKSLLLFASRAHFDGMANRASILLFLKDFVKLAGPNTLEVIKNFFSSTIHRKQNRTQDIFLPNNDKSTLENILKKNVYRSDKYICNNLASLLRELIAKAGTTQLALEVLDSMLYENEALLKEQIDENCATALTFEKNILFLNLLAQIGLPLSQKIDEHIMRYLKYVINMRNIVCAKECQELIEIRKLKLRNSLLSYFTNAFSKDSYPQLYIQFLKIASTLINPILYSAEIDKKYEQYKTCLNIMKVLTRALQNCQYQSILLYGQNIQNPSKAEPLLNLSHILSRFVDRSISQIIDENEQNLMRQIGLTTVYALCKLTTIDSKQFYSTQSRKNAINCLISPDRIFSVSDLLSSMDVYLPKQILGFLKNYNDFPIVQKPQVFIKQTPAEKNTSIGRIFSKSVFSMISENDPIGKTRFQFIQDIWEGGDTSRGLYRLKNKTNYREYLNESLSIPVDTAKSIQDLKFTYSFKGLHTPEYPNKVFVLKLKRNFTMKKNTQPFLSEITMKNNIPQFIKKPEEPIKNIPLNQLNTSIQPQIIQPNSLPQQNIRTTGSASPNLIRNTSNVSNVSNRSPSPYNPIQPTLPIQGNNYNYNQPNYQPTDAYRTNSYRPSTTPQHNTYPTGYNTQAYDQRYSHNMHNYDNQRNYYQGQQQQQPLYQQQGYNSRMVDPRMSNDPRMHNYPHSNYGGSQYHAPYPNYPMGSSSYGQQGYPAQNPQYVNQEALLQESLSLLQYLKSNQGDIGAKKRFQELMKDPYVESRISEFINIKK